MHDFLRKYLIACNAFLVLVKATICLLIGGTVAQPCLKWWTTFKRSAAEQFKRTAQNFLPN